MTLFPLDLDLNQPIENLRLKADTLALHDAEAGRTFRDLLEAALENTPPEAVEAWASQVNDTAADINRVVEEGADLWMDLRTSVKFSDNSVTDLAEDISSALNLDDKAAKKVHALVVSTVAAYSKRVNKGLDDWEDHLRELIREETGNAETIAENMKNGDW